MALSPLPAVQSITVTSTGSTTTVVDSTVYGTPNLDRNEVAVYLLAFKVSEDLTETSLDIAANDPLVVTQFIVTNTIDGWQRFLLMPIPIYDNGTAYAANSVVYEAGTLYKNISNATSTGQLPSANPAIWEEENTMDIYTSVGTSTEVPNVPIGVAQTVLTIKSQQCLGDIAPENARENCAGCGGDSRLKRKFDELWLLVYLGTLSSLQEKYIEGERFMRTAEDYCDSGCGCS
jgi:hypothetical protein